MKSQLAIASAVGIVALITWLGLRWMNSEITAVDSRVDETIKNARVVAQRAQEATQDLPTASPVPAPPMPVAPEPEENFDKEPSTYISTDLPPNTQTTKSGYLAAISKESLDEAIRYAVQKDEAALAQLIDSGRVFMLKPGLKVLIEECMGFLCSTVKIRPVGETITVYTVNEAVD